MFTVQCHPAEEPLWLPTNGAGTFLSTYQSIWPALLLLNRLINLRPMVSFICSLCSCLCSSSECRFHSISVASSLKVTKKAGKKTIISSTLFKIFFQYFNKMPTFEPAKVLKSKLEKNELESVVCLRGCVAWDFFGYVNQNSLTRFHLCRTFSKRPSLRWQLFVAFLALFPPPCS